MHELKLCEAPKCTHLAKDGSYCDLHDGKETKTLEINPFWSIEDEPEDMHTKQRHTALIETKGHTTLSYVYSKP